MIVTPHNPVAVTPESGLIAYWRLGEASGPRADSVGGFTLSVSSGSVGSGASFGNMGSVAASFPGNDLIYLMTASPVRNLSPWTWAGWVLFNAFQADGPGVWGQGTNTYVTQQLKTTGSQGATDTLRVAVDAATGGVFSGPGSPALSTGTWYLLTTTCVGSLTEVYVNDSATPNVTFVQTPLYQATRSLLGVNGVEAVGLSGRMVGWGVWNRVLTFADRAWLYNGGSGRFAA